MLKTSRPRVVVDTNLIVSGLMVKLGQPRKLLDAWRLDGFEIIHSMETLAEIRDVLFRGKFEKRIWFDEIDEFLTKLEAVGLVASPVTVEELLLRCRDPKDDIWLALGAGADADYLVTGDEDLLVLNGDTRIGKLKIITVKEFLEVLD